MALSQHDIGAGQEIVPNLPVLNVNQHLNQISQQLQQLAAQIAENHLALTGQIAGLNAQIVGLSGQFGALGDQVTQLVIAQHLLPMRLQNASSSLNAELRYPTGFVLVPLAPVLKQDLLSLNVGACQATAQALGLPALLGNPTVVQRRQEIIDHLGAGLTV